MSCKFFETVGAILPNKFIAVGPPGSDERPAFLRMPNHLRPTIDGMPEKEYAIIWMPPTTDADTVYASMCAAGVKGFSVIGSAIYSDHYIRHAHMIIDVASPHVKNIQWVSDRCFGGFNKVLLVDGNAAVAQATEIARELQAADKDGRAE